MSTNPTPSNLYELVLQQVQARRGVCPDRLAEQIARIQGKQFTSSHGDR